MMTLPVFVKPNDVVEVLRRRHLTVAFAESCTGGRLSADLTTVPGSSEVVLGSAVCYRIDMKQRILGLSGITEQNVVSLTTAVDMARSAKSLYGAHVGVSTTGWLDRDPNGGGPHAYYAMACPKGLIQVRHQVFSPSSTRDMNREQLVQLIFSWMATELLQDPVISR